MADLESRGGSVNGCAGCLVFVLALVVLWAFLFGVTYGGKHYGLALSCERGVVIE